MNDASPPRAPQPWLARLVTPAGPPRTAFFRHGESAILAFPGRFSVSYLLVEGQEVVIVDCSSTADLGAVGRALAWLGRTRDDVRYVLPTHLHFDHILGLDPLAERLGTSVALGEVAEEHVHRGRPLHWPRRRRLLRALPTWPMQGLQVFTQADWRQGDFGYPWSRNQFTAPRGPVLHHGLPLPGLPSWTVLACPGHSDDAICLLHRQAGWLVSGDTLRNFLGGEWNPLVTDPIAYRATKRALEKEPVRVVFPGHGPTFKVDGTVASVPTKAWYVP